MDIRIIQPPDAFGQIEPLLKHTDLVILDFHLDQTDMMEGRDIGQQIRYAMHVVPVLATSKSRLDESSEENFLFEYDFWGYVHKGSSSINAIDNIVSRALALLETDEQDKRNHYGAAMRNYRARARARLVARREQHRAGELDQAYRKVLALDREGFVMQFRIATNDFYDDWCRREQ